MCVAGVDSANAKGVVLNYSSSKGFREERAEQWEPGISLLPASFFLKSLETRDERRIPMSPGCSFSNLTEVC